MRLALEQEKMHSQVSSVSIAGLEAWVNPSSAPETTQRFLRIQLGEDLSCLVAVAEISAVRTISIAEIVPVPHVNACVLGFCREDQPLWLIDLAQQMGVSSLVQSSQTGTALLALVVKRDAQVLGLVVPEVHDIESYASHALSSPQADGRSPIPFPFMKGYFTDHRSIVLDISAVFENLSKSVS